MVSRRRRRHAPRSCSSTTTRSSASAWRARSRDRGYDVRTAADYDEAHRVGARRVAAVRRRRSEDAGTLGPRGRARPEGDRSRPRSIVVLTGYGSIATAVDAVKLGATHYLPKPADADEILAALDARGRRRRRRRQEFPAPSLARAEWEHIQRVLSRCRRQHLRGRAPPRHASPLASAEVAQVSAVEVGCEKRSHVHAVAEALAMESEGRTRARVRARWPSWSGPRPRARARRVRVVRLRRHDADRDRRRAPVQEPHPPRLGRALRLAHHGRRHDRRAHAVPALDAGGELVADKRLTIGCRAAVADELDPARADAAERRSTASATSS